MRVQNNKKIIVFQTLYFLQHKNKRHNFDERCRFYGFKIIRKKNYLNFKLLKPKQLSSLYMSVFQSKTVTSTLFSVKYSFNAISSMAVSNNPL